MLFFPGKRRVLSIACAALLVLSGCGHAHHSAVIPSTGDSTSQVGHHPENVQGPDGASYERNCSNGNPNCYVICSGRDDCAAKGYPGYDNVSVTFYGSGGGYNYGTGGAAGFYQGGVRGGGPGNPYNCFPSTNPACLQGRTAPYNSVPTRIRIFTAAHSYENTDTRTKFGVSDACAYAVSDIIKQVIPTFPIVANVEILVADMLAAGAVVVPASQAGPGDIVVQGLDPNTLIQWPTPTSGSNHVGVCVDGGCTTVLSNGSTPGTFATLSGPTFSSLSSNYSPNAPYTIFHFP